MKFASLLLIIFIGVLLRLNNLSSYKFYPDAYQSLIVAQNLLNYQNVIGRLGEAGMIYPQFFLNTRPVFPLLILNVPAEITALVCGILSIPLVYRLVYILFKSSRAALGASLVMTLSFNHTVWSGFLMSDTTGILLMLITLNLVFSRRSLLAGIFLGLGILSRYEYLLLILPIIWIDQKRVDLLTGTAVTLLLGLGLFYPPLAHVLGAVSQFPDIALALFILPFLVFVIWKIKILQIIFLAVAVVTLRLYLSGSQGFINFIRTDFALIITAALGSLMISFNRNHLRLLLFSAICMLLMTGIYLRINPLQQRYFTHLLPFLIIPAGFAFTKIKWLPIILIALQIPITAIGISGWDNGDWNNISYEEVSARQLKPLLNPGDVLVASMPEPYFYFTGHSTTSVMNQSPYFFLEHLHPDTPVVIIQDMATRDIFPDFSKYLDENYQEYKISQYTTNSNYHYLIHSSPENYPVQIYRLKKGQIGEF
jgi:hypothetical protein